MKTPTVSLYLRKENYMKLVRECERLGIGESELVNRILEVFFNAQKKKDVQTST